jgi:hypothetical protein
MKRREKRLNFKFDDNFDKKAKRIAEEFLSFLFKCDWSEWKKNECEWSKEIK